VREEFDVLSEKPEAQEFYTTVVNSFRLSRAVWLAAHFRLADIIGAGPASAAEIAQVSGTHPDAMRRLLDALTAGGLFSTEGDGRYGPTAASDLLRSDHSKSQRGLLDVVLGGEHHAAWGALDAALSNGQPGFTAAHGTSWIDYYTARPEAGRAFAEAMSGTTRAFEDAILEADPFPPFRFAVDVGGSHGSLLRRLLERNAEATGVVFDLAEVIADWPQDRDEFGDRLTGVAGDFFEAVPEGGDLYLMKFILHDWDDKRAEAILRRVRAAVRPAGWVAIVETVLPESPVKHPGWLMDLNMMAITGGQERTASAYATLLERARWRLERVVPTRSPLSVLLASAA
jgi:hypothetical protein